MNKYKLAEDVIVMGMAHPSNTVLRSDGAAIPLDPDNTDYAQFLKDWEAGAEVLNPDGTPAPYVALEAK